jgi:sulfite reductase beta subunit
MANRHSRLITKPTFHKLVAAGLPNNPPRWPEVTEVVKTILFAYKEDARAWERVGEWIDRIGWPRFFEMTGLAFTKHHIEDFRSGRSSLNASAHIHF